MSAPPPMNRKCQQIADVLYDMLIGPSGLLTDPKLPYDLRFVSGQQGVGHHVYVPEEGRFERSRQGFNLCVPGAEPVHIALNVQVTTEEEKEVIRLLQPRMQGHGYQRYCSTLVFRPQEWDGVLAALGARDGDTPEEAAQLQKMGNLVRSMMGQNGPEALAAALAEMSAMQSGRQ